MKFVAILVVYVVVFAAWYTLMAGIEMLVSPHENDFFRPKAIDLIMRAVVAAMLVAWLYQLRENRRNR